MATRGKQFVGGVLAGAGAVYWLGRGRSRTGRRPERARAAMSAYVGAPPATPEPEVRSGYGARRGDIAGLEAAALDTGGQSPASAERTATRILRALGAVLLLYSLVRRRRRGSRVARMVGLRLLIPAQIRQWRAARTAVPERPDHERRRIVDIQKSLHVEAPADQVYAFWSNYENFPLFMPSLRGVEDLGGGRSRWSIRGPGGVPLSWTARLTDQQPNRMLAWRSEPGALLEHAGVVRFQPEGTGTRVDVRFCYRPLAGRVGHVVTDLFGTDPRATLNESLDRLQALLEATMRSESHGQKPGT